MYGKVFFFKWPGNRCETLSLMQSNPKWQRCSRDSTVYVKMEIEIIIREVTDKNAADESARYTTYTHTRYNLRIASNYGFIYLYSDS
jgi:hypothetical protein